ncbi:MAG TPA: polysaccharide biosynthesis protein, partial [Thermoanaerobaculia bacterium]|nr:polysaccharide biosynthesis protein [Thermoanaerobaculia bacterium]
MAEAPASPYRPARGGWRRLATRMMRRETQVVLDLGALSLALLVAYLLRFDLQIPPLYLHRFVLQLPFVVLLQLAALALCGVYALIWRYVALGDLPRFLRAALYATLPLLLLRWSPSPLAEWRLPLSVIAPDMCFGFGGVLALRVVRRSLYERGQRAGHQGGNGVHGERAVLLAGAGRAGALVAREIKGRGDLGLRAVGFVDDDPLKLGMVVDGLRVLGATDEIPRLATELGVDHVILSMVDAPRPTLARIVALCQRSGVPVRTIPGLYEIVAGRVAISRTRDVDLESLLGRSPVQLDGSQVSGLLTGKRVLITGAGGSIGGELARQVCRLAPAELVLVERFEGALFAIEQELGELWPAVRLVPLLADAGNRQRMAAVLAEHRPEVLLHAAAHKHVPLSERNVGETIANNVFATRALGEAAAEAGVATFVLISTDKAVRPSSVMGASKRVAELVVADLAQG